MSRILGIVVLIGLTAGVSPADVLVVKSGRKKVKVHGLPDKVGDTEVSARNWRLFLNQSTGVIVEDNYDSVVWQKKASTKKTQTYPKSQVVEMGLAPLQRDANLDQGHGDLATGNLAAALRNFGTCAKNPEARTVDRMEAKFYLGFSHLMFGRKKSASKVFAAWDGGKSVYTPEALRLLAEIQTGGQKFKSARATYERISNLPDITEEWKYKARCGLVKVLIAERKYAEARKMAGGIAKEASKNKEDATSRALAMCLEAQAITFAQDEAAYPKAEKLLKDALDLKGVDATTMAFLNVTLGDALYSQKRIEEARFPYLRVPALYPQESGYCGAALLNAGNCFIDMSEKAVADGDQPKADKLLISGMKLLSEAGLKYKNGGARKVWKRNKAGWLEAKARTEKKKKN